MIIKQEYDMIYKHYIKDNIINNKYNNNMKKERRYFYDIFEDYNYEEKDLDIYEKFLYSTLLNYYGKDVDNIKINNRVFSWESIFNFLCIRKSINEIVKNTGNYSDSKTIEILKLIRITINNTIKEISTNDFNLYINIPIIYITRKAFVPKQLLYTSSTGLVNCPRIPSLEVYIGNKNGNTLIGVNDKSYRIIEWRSDVSKLLIRPIILSTHTIYTMYNICNFDKEYKLFNDVQSLLIVYYYLLKTDKDINIAKSLGLIKDKGISSNTILKFLHIFADKHCYEIEKLHELRIKHEMLYPENFYGPYNYTKNEYILINK